MLKEGKSISALLVYLGIGNFFEYIFQAAGALSGGGCSTYTWSAQKSIQVGWGSMVVKVWGVSYDHLTLSSLLMMLKNG